MDNLLSGALGALIGTIISSLLSYLIFRKQIKVDSNRIFLSNLLETIQDIYLSLQHGTEVKEDHIKRLISFRAIGLKEFNKINNKINELNTLIISYNEGVLKSLKSTTTTSHQINARSESEKKVFELIKVLRDMT
ncbi:MAG TPA: hypothetical protein VIS94_17700 [Desulfomonilia bacterium]